MKTVNVIKKITIAVLVLLAFSGFSANVTQINRYATVDNKPLASQINPLLTIQLIHFPQSIHTVGEALSYWLQYSGFAMVHDEQLPLALKEVLHQPLPQVDRHLGPLTIQEGLEVLVGQQVFSLVQDPLHRKISFKLKPQYAALLNQTKGRQS